MKLQARTWKADATPEQIGNALAGLHADYVAWFMDETGDYPDAIMPTVEAIFAGSPRVARIVQAGNPTRLSGPLYTAVSKARHLWTVIDITADCPSSDDLRQFGCFRKGGSGSSVVEIKRHAGDAASDDWRLSGA